MTQVLSKRLPIAVATAVPLLWALFLVIHAGRIPHHDYWDMQEEFVSTDGFSSRASDWFTATRAHLMPLTYLAYAANIVVTDGSNLGLSLLTWLLAAIQAVLLARLARRSGLSDWWIPVVAVFSFTSCAAEPWMMGFSGVSNVGAQTLAVASIYCLARPLRDGRVWDLGLGLALALLSGLTFSTGLPACLVAIVALAWRRVGWQWVVVAAAGAACLFTLRFAMVEAFYAPATSPPIRLPEPVAAIGYSLTLMGGIFSQTVEVAGALSAVGISIASIAAWKERRNPHARPWILLLLLSLVQVALITVGRWDNGATQAIASRYAPIPALFWLSTLSLLAIRLRGLAARVSLVVMVLALAAAMSSIGWRYGRTLLAQASLQNAATLSIRYKVADVEAIRISITPWTEQFLRNLRTLNVRGLVPFDRPLQAEWGSLREEARHARPRLRGDPVLGLHRFRERGFRMMAIQSDRGGSLILVNESGHLRGSAAPLRFAPYREVVWVGYARVSAQDQILRVVRIPEHGPPIQLQELELQRAELDERGLGVFKRIRELPRVHHAGVRRSSAWRGNSTR